MATYTERTNAKGETRIRAQIRIKAKGKIIHSEAKTFSTRKLAERWAVPREIELQKTGEMERARAEKKGLSIRDLIDRYMDEYKDIKEWQRSKQSDLKRLMTDRIADVDAIDCTTTDLVDHIRERRAAGAGPATAINDLIWLRVIYKLARPAWGIPLDPAVVDDAIVFCRTQKLIGRPRARERRPTAGELQALDAYFKETDNRHQRIMPMRKVFWFAIFSSRRRAEIARIRRSDDDAELMTGLVRDAKHPRAKIGNHKRFNYTLEAWAVAQSMQGNEDRAFPFTGSAIGKNFTEACKRLGIDDLRFHDLRHEATSRLFEAGLSIVEVQSYTLHEDWNLLKRYTHVTRGHQTWTPDLAELTGLPRSTLQQLEHAARRYARPDPQRIQATGISASQPGIPGLENPDPAPDA